MLWHYPFFDDEVCRLQEYVADFFSRANAEGNPPRSFSLDYHCCPSLRLRCESSAELKSRLKSFYTAFVNLQPSAKQKTFAAFQAMNAIDDQLQNRRERYTLIDLPTTLRAPTKKLFVFLYENTLRSGGAIANHWGRFYEQLDSKDCPFCAIEPLHHPDFYKQDYDHLLCKDIYPFAAVNMRNLVPMGRDCNTIFKKTKDVLFKKGLRRRAFRPFASSGARVQIKLTGSKPPTVTKRNGIWKVKIGQACQEVATWIDVFETPRRYEKEILETKAVGWIEEFRNVAILSTPMAGWTVQRLRTMLGKYAKTFESGSYQDWHFLKAPFYAFLHKLDSSEFLSPLLKSIQ